MSDNKKQPAAYLRIPIDTIVGSDSPIPIKWRLYLYYAWGASELKDFADYRRWTTIARIVGYEVPTDPKERESVRKSLTRTRDRLVKEGWLSKDPKPGDSWVRQFQALLPHLEGDPLDAFNEAHGAGPLTWVSAHDFEEATQRYNQQSLSAAASRPLPPFVLCTDKNSPASLIVGMTRNLGDRLPFLLDLENPKILSWWTKTFPKMVKDHAPISGVFDDDRVRNTVALWVVVTRAEERGIDNGKEKSGKAVGPGLLKHFLGDAAPKRSGKHLVRRFAQVANEIDELEGRGVKLVTLDDIVASVAKKARRRRVE